MHGGAPDAWGKSVKDVHNISNGHTNLGCLLFLYVWVQNRKTR